MLQPVMPVYHKPNARPTTARNCSVCMREAEDTTRLACDHTFCQPCVRNQISRLSELLDNQKPITIVCPYCKDFLVSSISLRRGGKHRKFPGLSMLDEPLRPKSVSGKVSEYRSSYAGKPQRCMPCAEGQSFELASFWCQNCSEYFCSVCARYHQAMKMSHDHVVKTIRDKERYGHVKSKVDARTRPQTAKDLKPSHLNCEPCSQNRKSKTAEFLCQNCREQMCEECSKCHRSMKMSKSHRLLAIIDVLSKSDSQLSLDIKCERHKGEDLSLYCKRCRTSCCTKCAISDHSSCGKTVKLETGIGTDTKSKAAITGVKESVKDVTKVDSKTGPIKYSWDSKAPSDDKTVSFSITPAPNTKVTIPKNKMELRKRRIDIECNKANDWVISLAVLTSGDILLIQLYEPTLTLVNRSGDVLDMCKFYGDPWSVAVHKDSLAVISFSDRKQLQLVRITRAGLEPGRKLSTRHKCLAVCFAKNLIAASCWEGCVHLINISGEELCYLDTNHNGERLFTNPEYIASDVTGSVVYVTDYKRNSVTALSVLPSKIVNKPVFVFTDTELNGPKGVAVDKNGSIYVSGMSSRNIFRLSPAGAVVQVYRRREDRDYYEAIAVTSDSDKLFVSAYEDSTIIEYKLTKR